MLGVFLGVSPGRDDRAGGSHFSQRGGFQAQLQVPGAVLALGAACVKASKVGWHGTPFISHLYNLYNSGQ